MICFKSLKYQRFWESRLYLFNYFETILGCKKQKTVRFFEEKNYQKLLDRYHFSRWWWSIFMFIFHKIYEFILFSISIYILLMQMKRWFLKGISREKLVFLMFFHHDYNKCTKRNYVMASNNMFFKGLLGSREILYGM